MIRTHAAGTLRPTNVGEVVTLAGWVARRRDHGGVTFIDLRDASGFAQVVFRDEETAHALRNEYCVKVTGTVSARPAGNENPELPTGAIEVIVSELEVLSTAAPLPFPIDDHVEAGDDIRLRHRYLDLRRTAPSKALKLRSRANQIAREILHQRDFHEIETPTLTRSTPEGARDFLVPVRLQPGNWYALPQSPQLFKQLLMVAGMERYYQTLWRAREVLEAECLRPGLRLFRRRRFGHRPPTESCECGIYAADASTAASYGTPPADRVDRRILGRVALWGIVVECEHGWRASHAYPYEIVIPVHRFRDDTLVPLEALAFDLTAYGVPVVVADEEELSDLMRESDRIEF